MRYLFILLVVLPLLSFGQFRKILKDNINKVDINKGKELVSNRLSKTREKFDTTSFSYSVSFSDQSILFEDKEKFDNVKNAASIYLDKDKSKTVLEEVREQIDLGEMYYASNGFKMAEVSFIAAVTLLELNGYQKNLMYPRVLADMGMLYNEMSRYNLAMDFTQRAIESRKELRGEQSVDYAASLNNLAVLNKNLGDFNAAERELFETIEISKKVSGVESMPYAIALNNRGVLYQNLGRYEEAEKDMLESLAAVAKNLNANSAKYAKFQTNLGLLYQQQGKYTEAETIYQSAIDAVSRNPVHNKKINPDYAHLIEMKASLYLEIGKNEEAEELLIEALDIYERKFGTEFSGYGLTKARLGRLYRRIGNLAEAESNLMIAKSVLSKTYGENHPHYVELTTELALLKWQQSKINEAYELFKQSLNQSLVFVGTYFAPMSDVEKAAFWNTLRPRFEKYYAFTAETGANNADILNSAVNYRLATKAMLLSSTTKVKSHILASKDQQLIEAYHSWIDNKRQLAMYYSMSKEDLTNQEINTDSLEQVTNKIEKQLSEKSGIFNEAYGSKVPIISEVQQKIKIGEAAVEMVRVGYSLTNEGCKYMALIVFPDKVKMALLPNGDQLETRYTKYYKNAIMLKREDNYSYEQFWKPIDVEIGSVKKLYLSSDGVFNQLNVNSFKNPSGTYLLNQLQILNVSSLRSLVEPKSGSISTKTAFVMGNPTYGSNEIDPLPGTGKEINAVTSILKSNGFKAELYQTTNATEKKIKEVHSPMLMHIATHGFFINDIKADNNQVFSVPLNNVNENVLLRSGLLLAHAGHVNETASLSDENGILTAYEAMNLDLTNTDLVVLSACETGLGDVIAGEGVYGLQRSFQVAGAKAVIMSLWKVDDEATQLLMMTFYRNWIKTKDKLNSFTAAQKSLKATYPAPYYWGAFVMLGE